MKLVTVVGARPQFIKAAAMSQAVRKKQGVEEIIIHTGQHYDPQMSDLFFEELDIPKPKYHLGIGGLSHGAMTGRMLEEIEKILLDEKPDVVLVYGDTNSTVAAALAAVKIHIPIAHVEAGLRSHNLKMPEEWNRKLTDQMSTWLFAPTEDAKENLLREGIEEDKIFVVGDIMLDVAMLFKEKAKARSKILNKLSLLPKKYFLMTIHRQENTDDPKRLRGIVEGISFLKRLMPIVLPLHPRTAKVLDNLCLLEMLKNHAQVIEPVGYLDMAALESHASLILTDSGGVQKEAYFYHVPCVTLRDETEWKELVESGCNVLSPCQPDLMLQSAQRMLQFNPENWPSHLYGQGNSSEQILNGLLERH